MVVPALTAGMDSFQVFVSPYSPGCMVEAELISVSKIAELERASVTGKILLLHGEIAKEQLMPKNFVFYNPEEHQQIVAMLERGAPIAIICATGRNASLAGGVYPFPLIEDGDFDIPSVYMTEDEGARLSTFFRKQGCLKFQFHAYSRERQQCDCQKRFSIRPAHRRHRPYRCEERHPRRD